MYVHVRVKKLEKRLKGCSAACWLLLLVASRITRAKKGVPTLV